MNEVLLQTIVEKLEALELAWRVSGDEEKNRLELLRNDIKIVRNDLKNSFSTQTNEISILEQLSKRLESLNVQLLSPTKQQIQHKHELHKGILISIFLFMVTLLLFFLLIHSHQNNKQYRANDLKYRYIKLSTAPIISNLCSLTDSLYSIDHVLLRSKVELEERRLIEQAKFLRLAEEKEREAKLLKKRAGERP